MLFLHRKGGKLNANVLQIFFVERKIINLEQMSSECCTDTLSCIIESKAANKQSKSTVRAFEDRNSSFTIVWMIIFDVFISHKQLKKGSTTFEHDEAISM